MEKLNPHSDSEDEAFESADEGELDSRPTQEGDDSATKDDDLAAKTEEKQQASGSQDMSKEKEDVGCVTVDEGSSETLSKEKDESTEEERNGVEEGLSNDLIADVKAGLKKEEDNERLVENECKQASEEGKSEKNDIGTVDDVSSHEIEGPAEPMTEQIRESAKGPESQSPILQAMDRLAEASPNNVSSDAADTSSPTTSSWGWGGWGSMLSKATSSVSSMLETVETQLGIPSPTEMANLAAKSKSNPDNQATNEPSSTELSSSGSESRNESAEGKPDNQKESAAGLGSWLSGIGMSHLSSVVQSTGKEIVSGGLDALEFVGKKTIDAISHGDPGFRRRRVTLSQAIREAKEKVEQSSAQSTDNQVILNAFSVEFDKFQGLAHLEALEIISRESEQEFEKLLKLRAEESVKDSDELLATLKSMFQVDDDDDEYEEHGNDSDIVENFDEIISEQVASLSLSVTPAKLISAFNSSKSKSEKQDNDARSAEDLYSETVSCFAELTARSVEIFHKIGEFMLLPDVKASLLAKTRGNALSKICSVLRASVSALSTRFATNLNERKPENDDAISKIITDIYLEASNSSSHISDSFRLLLPILQLSTIKQSSLSP